MSGDEKLIAEYRELIREYYSLDSEKETEEIMARLQWIAGQLGWHREYEIINKGYWGNELDSGEIIPQIER